RNLRDHRGPVRAVGADEEDVDALLRRQRRALERDQQPLDAGSEADPRRMGAAERFCEAVVAPAAGERRLRPAFRPDELPGRARVVVEPADERRDELVANADGVEVAADLAEMLAAG